MIDNQEAADVYSDEPLVIILSEMLNVASEDLIDDIRNLLYSMQDLQTVECSMVQEIERPEEFAVFNFKNEAAKVEVEEPKKLPKNQNATTDQKIITL